MNSDDVRLRRTDDGVEILAPTYRLLIRDGLPRAELSDAAGTPLGSLALLTDVDTTVGLDATDAFGQPEIFDADSAEPSLALPIHSALWGTKRVVLTFGHEEFRLRVDVAGVRRSSGGRTALAEVTDCRLLGGRWIGTGRWPTGDQRTSIQAQTLFCPAPEDPRRVARSAAEAAAIGVTGSSLPGQGHWFFTPAPFCFGLSPRPSDRTRSLPEGPWLMLGLADDVRTAGFTGVHYEPLDGGFALRLAYEGQTEVAGSWTSPEVIVRPGAQDPYSGLVEHRKTLRQLGLIAESGPRPRPGWWAEPVFCGWGAQCHQARLDGSHPRDHARQPSYDKWLSHLAERGVIPGTIVIDDRWQAAYGMGTVDEDKWPDLRGWIADRHARDQRVLLWWKAWDPEGLPAKWCVTTPDGRPVSADPSNPAYRAFLSEAIGRLLAPDGLDADGLKVDFSAQTPSGPGLRRRGLEWGVSLLHALLAGIHEASRDAKADALVVAHAPNPGFGDVAGMIRLNDVLRLEDADLAEVDVVAQMRYRAAIARAACPDLLIETDDWAMPDREAWRAYLAEKPRLGVPSLYFATHLDLTGEPLTDDDFEAVRESWAEYRRTSGLPLRPSEAIERVASR